MTALQKQVKNSFFFVFLFFPILQCAPYPIYTQKNHVWHPEKSAPKAALKHVSPAKNQVPLSVALEVKTKPIADTLQTDSYENGSFKEPASQAAKSADPQVTHTASRFIRIALGLNVKKAQFSSAGQVDIVSLKTSPVSFRGTADVRIINDQNVVFENLQEGKLECALPCTLHSKNDLNIINYNGTAFRGSIILTSERRGSFTVINYTQVEDYLRGVVPLEIGHCKPEETEAVKAQAIAARTYTYKKILEKRDAAFDLLPTISDQVYGGVSAEDPLCSEAILSTADQVMVYNDTLIYAYYSSTCGGKTATINDVWENKQPLAYLRSVVDVDDKGEAYCGFSTSFTWEESWSYSQLTSIVNRFSRETFPQNAAPGPLLNVVVKSRFACGRVEKCMIKTSAGSFSYGGDKIRFVLRRNKSSFPILRSALITDISTSAGSIFIKGKGYGHGVGMCQFGAIGRARSGQACERILKTYYTGVEIIKIGSLK